MKRVFEKTLGIPHICGTPEFLQPWHAARDGNHHHPTRADMLRITPTTENSQPCLRLEGRLAGPWVTELSAAVEAQRRVKPLCLDLAHVPFVDAAGLDLLVELRQHGTKIIAASPFVTQLLQTHRA